jgi:hypothetical protein
MTEDRSTTIDTLRTGMAVFGVNDLRVGQVVRVNGCCLELTGDYGSHAVAHDCIFNVSVGRVTLICAPREVRRYACPDHSEPE